MTATDDLWEARMSHQARIPALALVALALLAFLAPRPALAEDIEPVPLTRAEEALGRLNKSLKNRKSINEQLIANLDEVAEAYHNLEAPLPPELQEIPDGAPEEEAKAIKSANEKLTRGYEAEMAKFEAAQKKFRKDAQKAFIKAFKLTKIHKPTETNQRDDVNIKAVEILGNTGDPDVSADIIKALESGQFKAKGYLVPELLLETAFGALGKLNDEKSLAWMLDNFVHTNNDKDRVNQLVAAHKAMILFKDVPGKTRYAIVEEMVKLYAGTEATASQSSTDVKVQAAKQFWDRIKNDAIKVVQVMSGEPTDDQDQVLATMKEFQNWFRDHDNKRDPAWKDPEPKPE